MSNSIQRLTMNGMFTAFAIIVSYIEVLIPFNIGIPGVKLGLANFVIVICLYNLSLRETFVIDILRILIINMMFGNIFSFAFSIAGGMFSLTVMILFKKIKDINIVTVSVAGGVSHNIAQIIIAMFLVDNYSVMYYAPVLIVAGIITGMAIGTISIILNKRIKVIKRMEK